MRSDSDRRKSRPLTPPTRPGLPVQFEYSSGPAGVVAARPDDGAPDAPSPSGLRLATLRDVLTQWSERVGMGCDATASAGGGDESVREVGGWRVAGEGEPVLHADIFRGRLAQVIVGGIEPPLSSTLAGLHDALRSADAFLYIAVRLFAAGGGSH